MQRHSVVVRIFVCAAMSCAFSAASAKDFKGPVEASVLKVLDGDTFLAEAHIWPGHWVRVNVRIRGIDTPEMRSRCVSERDAALQAQVALSEFLGEQKISISNIGGAKYHGRVLADVETGDGLQVAAAMIESQFARAYSGGKRKSWCD
ncbi:thermonuclease family protein [Mesorhizobium sp. SB112]|uniref:thermonuclease family protein n=1 Tax=Mesorhizobium sp. SB112 TaxID=3151853 RepID=UPI0032664AD0